MPDNKTISELLPLPSLADLDEFLLNQSGTTYNATAKTVVQYAKAELRDTFISLPETATDGQVATFIGGRWSAASVNETQGNADVGPVRFLGEYTHADATRATVVMKDGYLYGIGEVGLITANKTGRPTALCPARFMDDDDLDYFASNPEVTIEKVISGGSWYTALLSNGTVWVNSFCGYKVGLGYTDANDPAEYLYGFKQVKFADNAVIKDITIHVSGANDAECTIAVSEDDNAYVWGWNGFGQLGTGNTTTVYVPTKITTDGIVDNVKSAYLTGNGTEVAVAVIITKDNNVWVCGSNGNGQLGQGNTNNVSTFTRAKIDSSTEIGGVDSVVGGFNGRYNLFFVKLDGTVWGAGNNDGYQLGDGTTTGSFYFKQIAGLADIIEMKRANCYYSHIGTQVCLSSTGKVYTWGYNYYGTCGNGTEGPSYSYVTTPYEACSSGATKIFTSNSYNVYAAVAYLKNKHLYVTGYKAYTKPGPIANTTQSTFYPVHLNNVVNAIFLPRRSDDISNGVVIMQCENDHLYAYGSNYSGILGDSNSENSNGVIKLT